MEKKIVALGIIFILIQSLVIPVLASSISDLRNQQSDLQDKVSDAKEKQEEVSEELDEQMQAISELDLQITQSENEIKQLEYQITELEKSIITKQEEIEEKQQEYDENDQLLSERLVIMYEQGNPSFLDMLFGSANLMEFLSNYYTYSELTQCDIELLESIQKEKQEIEEAKKTLEEQKNQVVSLKKEKETKSNMLKNKKIERQQKASELSETQKQLQSEIDSYNQKIKEIDNAVAEALRKAMEEEEKRKQQGQGSNFDGTFIWPLDYSPRRVTSRMKWRWGRWHKGIDIGTNAEDGKTVIAAASGTVIYSAYQSGTSASPGYGHYLIIYHGNGFCTLYAHMSSKTVSTGQRVSQGQTIGYSGSTGGVAPHLHFEIRKASSISNFFGNNWLDPLDYLPGGYTIVD